MANRSEKKKPLAREIPAIRAGTDTVEPHPLSWFSHDWFWGLVLLLDVFLTYSPVWWAGFVWDDEPLLASNAAMVGLDGLKDIWTTSVADICPFTFTTFWVEHAFWGAIPLPYHLVNVVLHAGCAILLWRVLLLLRVPGACWARHSGLSTRCRWSQWRGSAR